jgi:poly(U)-specific endoribonuclease
MRKIVVSYTLTYFLYGLPEHVFVGEIKNGEISGFHNWVQFYLQEQNGSLDYRGYIKPRSCNDALPDESDQLLTLQFTWKGVEKMVGSSFIGVSPEFEFALYTMCFLAGEEENQISLRTGGCENDAFGVCIKCYKMAGDKIGTSFPEIQNHFEE